LLAAQLRQDASAASHEIVLAAMTRSGLTVTPASWLDELARRLAAANEPLLAQQVSTARQLPLPKEGHAALQAALAGIGRRADAARPIRLEALQAAGPLTDVEEATFAA